MCYHIIFPYSQKMAALTKEDLRDYVMLDERVVADGYVLLDMRHNLTTVCQLSSMIYPITRQPPSLLLPFIF